MLNPNVTYIRRTLSTDNIGILKSLTSILEAQQDAWGRNIPNQEINALKVARNIIEYMPGMDDILPRVQDAITEVQNALQNYCPSGYFFGAAPADARLIGVWHE